MRSIGHFRTTCALLACSLVAGGAAHAQGYPVRPVRVIVANTPGGGADTIARLVAEVLTDALRQQVVVDNRGGGGGRIGMELAAHSAPDGYTLALGTGSNLATVPAMYKKINYDPVKSFAPISLAATTSYMLVAHPSIPVRTVGQLLKLPESRSGGLNYASTGPGTFSHLGGELLRTLSGLKATHIAFKGSASATLSLIQGETDVMFSNFLSSLSLVQAGRLKSLGVTSFKRSPVVPDIPTLDESGLKGFEMQQFYALLAPAGTSPQIVQRLSDAMAKRLLSHSAGKKLGGEGTDLDVSSPAELEKRIISEIAKWTTVVKTAGIAAPE